MHSTAGGHQLWEDVATRLRDAAARGLWHLLTEDRLRWFVIESCLASGEAPDDLAVEVRDDASSRSTDLVLAGPPRAALELKCPRDSEGSADTMTLGEVLRDFYKLAEVEADERCAVQLFSERFVGYVDRHTDRHLSLQSPSGPGDAMTFDTTVPTSLPKTAADLLLPWRDGPWPNRGLHLVGDDRRPSPPGDYRDAES